MMYGGMCATIWGSARSGFVESNPAWQDFKIEKKSSFKSVAAWRSCFWCQYPWHKLWACFLRKTGAPKDMGRGIGQGAMIRSLKSS